MENFNDMYQLLKNSKEVIIDYFLSKDIEYYSNIKSEKEMKEQEKIRASNEIEHNIENNRFIETNMPLIAGEGCFVMLDNFEV